MISDLSTGEIFGYSIMFLTAFFFGIQLYSWLTGKMPKKSTGLIIGTVLGIGAVLGSYYLFPLPLSYINASIMGGYGYWGYLYIAGIISVNIVFIYNALMSWNKNTLEIIQ